MIKRSLVAAAVAVITGTMLIASTPGTAMAEPRSITSYSYESEPGDYIGGGGSASYDSPPASITVGGGLGSLTVNVTSGSDWWFIDIAAPRGEQLRPGTYHDAERAAFRTGRAPGLDVGGNGRGCNEVYGQFTIDQIAVDSNGAISVLDARFTQRCESATAARLTGTVRYRAFPLSYRFVSEPGDYIGGGITKSYTNATTIFTLSGTTQGLTFSVSGRRDDWSVRLVPPSGQQLQVGTYPNAQRAPFQEPGRPGLSVSGNGRGCNTLTGSFAIQELVVDGSGAVKALRATYEQHCEGGTPALRGTIRYFA